MTDRLKPYIPVCDAITALLTPRAEAVLHDLSTGLIYYIANAYSRRRAGEHSLNSDDVGSTLEGDVIGPYGKTNWNGGRLKSVTAVLRDEDGTAFGLLCINHDIEAFAGLADQLATLIRLPEPALTTTPLIAGDWRETVHAMIGQVLGARSTTLSGMTAADMDVLIGALDSKGIFEIRKAVPYVAEILKLSRATIYNRLAAIRQRHNASPETD